MIFHFSPKSALLLVFFIHGIVFAFLLLIKGIKENSQSSSWLSLFVFLCCLYISPFMLGYAGWYGMDGYREVLFYLPLQQLLLIGPVMYFYTRRLLHPTFVMTRKEMIHFLPAILYLIYSFIVFVTDVLILEKVYFYADGKDKDLDPWYQVAGLASMLLYFGLSLWEYGKYKALAFQVLSFAEAVLYRWVQRFLLAFVIILLLRVLFFILNPEWGEFGAKFWYYLSFSVLFYYISINGYSQAVRMTTPLLAYSSEEGRASIDSLEKVNESELLSEPPTPAPQIPELDSWKKKLESLMKEKLLYQDHSLTLMDVAEALQTTPKQVSQVVNQGFEINFNDFVNYYRTRAVIDKFRTGAHRRKTLLALALECGFNSKSTFNRAFKKHAGMTPGTYIKKLSEGGVSK